MKFLKSIREGLKDPKKKSITLLVIYFIFFIFVFIILNNGKEVNYNYESQPKIEEPKEVINEVLNYDYKVTINDNENITENSGTYITGIEEKNEYKNIELLIENSDSETKYKDSNKVVYNIKASRYFELISQENNCDEIDCTLIYIPMTIEKEEYINSALIDLSNYYGYTYTIQIEYSNINLF